MSERTMKLERIQSLCAQVAATFAEGGKILKLGEKFLAALREFPPAVRYKHHPLALVSAEAALSKARDLHRKMQEGWKEAYARMEEQFCDRPEQWESPAGWQPINTLDNVACEIGIVGEGNRFDSLLSNLMTEVSNIALLAVGL